MSEFRMKASIASFMLLVLAGSLAPQPIFIGHKGEKRLIEVSKWSDEEIANKGAPCGKYFLYQRIPNQDLVTLKVLLTEKEERVATVSLIGNDMRAVSIRLDNEKRIPTAEWVVPPKESWFNRQLLIRISGQDYVSAPCLTIVNPS
jgi:hypothetical protein